ncbi:MAG: glutamine--fructose-6-phosphate transaminase (isomerizing) [Cyanobacteria bacterium HKST-UBA06]|nr:glutamine--fructose-6-phosphate transaminase (isomerizing) [Cyanobacteria bacterium HKST-UBA06]
MCGIVGYIGKKPIVPLLLNGLQTLEYRGYDSAGIAWLGPENDLCMFKKEGKLSNLRSHVDALHFHNDDAVEYRGIAHTRWATHGSPTDENAHPHTSADGNIVLIHNGIIENYTELRDELKAKGYSFKSSTDTETIVLLLEDILKTETNFLKALQRLTSRLVGAYALGIMDKRQMGKLYGVRNFAPLVLGVGDGEMFLASDSVAIVEHTNEVVFLKDGQIVELTATGYHIEDFAGKQVITDSETIAASQMILDKKGFRHFMLKEIYDQPDVIRRLLSEHLKGDTDPVSILDKPALALFKNPKRIVIVGCGSSLNAGLVGKYFMEAVARIDVNVESAGEYRYRDTLVDEDTIIIAISQSGETADTLTAIRQCKEKGAKVVTVTNRVDSTMARESDAVVNVHAGLEVSVCATKSFVAQVVVLYLLGLQVAEDRGTLKANELENLKHQLKQLPTQIETMLANTDTVHTVAKKYGSKENMLFIGRSMNYPTAMEGALKLKEVSYIHAEGYSASELKHGPIAMLDQDMPIVAVLTPGPLYEKMISSCQEAKARDAQVIAIHAGPVQQEVADTFDDIITVPTTHEWLSPVVAVVPMQFLAYYIAEHLGKDVDQPRNLAKSVTVE